MEDLSYQRYLSDPRVREEIEEEVRRLQHDAVDTWIVEPVRRAWRRVCRPLQARTAPALSLSRRTAIETTIEPGETLCIEDAEGFEIKLMSGRLWITQQDDIGDYMLEPHQAFRVKRNGTTLAHAFRRASVHIACRAEAAGPTVPATPRAVGREAAPRRLVSPLPLAILDGAGVS